MTAEVAAYSGPRNNLAADLAYAQALSEADILPRHFQGSRGNVLWAVGFGQMVNIHPVAAMIGVQVIDNKPSASAALISALVRRAGHRLRVWTITNEKGLPEAFAELTRKDDPDFTYRVHWTLDRAEKAKLGKLQEDGRFVSRSPKGEPMSWEKYTLAMLKHRAVSEVARDACEEVLFGMHYTPEELGAQVDEEGNVEAAPSSDGEVVDAEVVAEPAPPSAVDVAAELRASIPVAPDTDDVRRLWRDAQAAALLDVPAGMDGVTYRQMLEARAAELQLADAEAVAAEVLDAQAVDESVNVDAPAEGEK